MYARVSKDGAAPGGPCFETRRSCAATLLSMRPSPEFHDVARGIAAPSLEQVKGFQRGLVAGDEQDCGLFRSAIDVLEPGAAGHREGVERAPIETLAVDDGIAAAFEWRDQQACSLTQRPRALARAQHLHKERHGLEHRTAGERIDIFDGDGLVGIAVP